MCGVETMIPISNTDELPPHRAYDHTIDLEPEKSPLLGHLNAICPAELEMLKNYVCRRLHAERLHSTFPSPLRHAHPLCQESEWIPSPLCRLSRPQQDHQKEPVFSA